MKTLTLDSFVDIADIYAGSLRLLPPIAESVELGNFAKKIVEEAFETLIEEIDSSHLRSVELFIKNATHCKSTFTNSKTTEDLLRSLISKRYPKVKQGDLLFDVPRLRIIPNSDIFSSGISYNYLPHRDTWYGAGHNQVNHWMALSNVTPNSTFYMAPSFFEAQISNSSSEFDLDTWNDVHRPQAGSNVATESRPHPTPLSDLPESSKFYVCVPKHAEIAFSAHHLHGSGKNVTDFVRFSIDYRVAPVRTNEYILPANIDSQATGDYGKFLKAF